MTDELGESADNRLRRIETRVTRLCLALGVNVLKPQPPAANLVTVDAAHRELVLPNMDVTLLEMANAVMAEGGDLGQAWNLVLRDRTLGTITLEL